MKKIVTIAGLALVSAIAGSANAQLIAHKDLSVTTAVTIAQTAVQTCKAQGYNVSAHVLGRSGEVLVAMRGDDTGPHTLENSMKKAWTARAQRAPSLNFANAVKANPRSARFISATWCPRRAGCRSWSATTPSARSACRAPRAATRTKPAPKPASTKSRPI